MKIATAILLLPAALFAQEATPPVSSGSFENTPTFSAAAIFNPAWLSGQRFTVRDAVRSYSGGKP